MRVPAMACRCDHSCRFLLPAVHSHVDFVRKPRHGARDMWNGFRLAALGEPLSFQFPSCWTLVHDFVIKPFKEPVRRRFVLMFGRRKQKVAFNHIL